MDLDVTSILPDATEAALKERLVFTPYYTAAEQCAVRTGMVFGGLSAMELSLGREFTKDTSQWEFYSNNAYLDAKALAEECEAARVASNEPSLTTHIIYLQTNIKNRELTVVIDTRPVFKVYYLGNVRGVSLRDLMCPVTCKGWFGSELKCFPQSINLIDTYRVLYRVNLAKEWPVYREIEQALYTEFKKSDRACIVGGADPAAFASDKLLKLAKQPDIVLVGDFALLLAGITNVIRKPRIQFITQVPPKQLAVMMQRAIAKSKDRVNALKAGAEIEYNEYALYIPSDFQITRYTYYINVKRGNETKKLAIADSFNCSEYEMIPYRVGKESGGSGDGIEGGINGIKYASPFVLLRHVFIDIWSLKLISEVSSTDMSQRISELVYLADAIRAYIITDTVPMETLFIGNNKNTVAAKKKLQSEGKRVRNQFIVS